VDGEQGDLAPKVLWAVGVMENHLLAEVKLDGSRKVLRKAGCACIKPY